MTIFNSYVNLPEGNHPQAVSLTLFRHRIFLFTQLKHPKPDSWLETHSERDCDIIQYIHVYFSKLYDHRTIQLERSKPAFSN